MNIAQVIPSLAARNGGPPFFVVGLGNALQQRDHEVTVFTTNIAGPAQSQSIQLGVEADQLPVGSGRLDVRTYPTRHPYRLVTSPALHRSMAGALGSYDLLHIHSLNLFPQFAAWRAAAKHDVPYVVSPHGALDPYIRGRASHEKRIIDALWQGRMLRGAGAFHATSEQEASAIERAVPNARTCVIPIGTDTERVVNGVGARFRSRFCIPAEAPLLLNHGRLAKKKGLDILLQAAERLWPQYPGLIVALVGPDDEGVSNELVEALPEPKRRRIIATGHLDGTDLADAIDAADVWLLPSRSENFGMAVVEAMAAGKPVIISPHVDIGVAAGQAAAALVVENDPGSVAEAIESLFSDRARGAALGQRAQAFAARFDWAVIAAQFEELYASVIHDHQTQHRKVSR